MSSNYPPGVTGGESEITGLPPPGFCEWCGEGPTCTVCGRDDRPSCDVCKIRVDPGTGYTTGETVLCQDCADRMTAELEPPRDYDFGENGAG